MGNIDRNRIDRVPTKVERWVGVVLAAVASVVFLALFCLGLLMLDREVPGRAYTFWFVGVTGLMAAGCVILLYRLAFTEPRAASARTSRIMWTAFAVVSTAAFLATLIWSAPRATSPMLGMLAALAISRMAVAWSVARASKSQG